MHTSALRTSLLALLMLVPLAPSAVGAIDADAAAFRKAAKTSQREVSKSAGIAVKAAKDTLKGLLAELVFEQVSLAAAHEAATQALLAAKLEMVAGAVQAAQALSALGAGLLEDPAAAGPDFGEGRGGAWDTFKAFSEAQLDKGDLRLESEFARFVKGLGNAAKSEGTAINVRFRVLPHDRRLDEVLGPALSASQQPAPPSGVGVPVRQIMIQSRFLVADQDPVGALGIALFDADQAELRFRNGAGDEVFTPTLDVTSDGSILFDMAGTEAWASGMFEATLRALGQDSDMTNISSPRIIPKADQPPEMKGILKQFKKSLANELKFGGILVKNGMKAFKQGTKAGAKAQKQGLLSGAELARQAGELALNSLNNQGIWLPVIQYNPVTEAATAMSDAGLGDADVTGDLVPDGLGLYATFLGKLSKKLAKGDRALAKALGKFESKTAKLAHKQGEHLATSLRMPGRDPAFGFTLHVAPTVLEHPDRGPSIALGLIVSTNNGGVQSSVTLGGVSSLDAGLVNLDVTRLPGGDTFVIGGLTPNPINRRWQTPPTPLAGLPVLGYLFRARNEQVTRTELLIMVKPVITDDT